MQTRNGQTGSEREREFLRGLDAQLRAAIRAALVSGQSQLAVALDTARDFLEAVLAEENPAPSRLAVARARVDMALAVWQRMNGGSTVVTDTGSD